MLKQQLTGASIDAHIRSRGAFSLTNLEGTLIVQYTQSTKRRPMRVDYHTPNLAALRNFLVTQARLGQ